MTSIDILFSAETSPAAVICSLSGIAGQTQSQFRLIVAGTPELQANPIIQSLVRVIEARGATVDWFARPAGEALSERRAFLLAHATAQAVLVLDDTVWLAPATLRDLLTAQEQYGGGFVGAFPHDLSRMPAYPTPRAVLFDGPAQPHLPESDPAAALHQGSNVYDLGLRVPPGAVYPYAVRSIDGCVLYDRALLERVGGFGDTGQHAEAQLRLLEQAGGYGVVPSGAFSAIPSQLRQQVTLPTPQPERELV